MIPESCLLYLFLQLEHGVNFVAAVTESYELVFLTMFTGNVDTITTVFRCLRMRTFTGENLPDKKILSEALDFSGEMCISKREKGSAPKLTHPRLQLEPQVPPIAA